MYYIDQNGAIYDPQMQLVPEDGSTQAYRDYVAWLKHNTLELIHTAEEVTP